MGAKVHGSNENASGWNAFGRASTRFRPALSRFVTKADASYLMATHMHPLGSRSLPTMSTINLIQQPEQTLRDWTRSEPFERSSSVTVVESVNADRYRIFQALTLPEYVEAWLSIPQALPGSTAVSMASDFWAITYAGLNGDRARFICTYKVLRRSKIQFTWKRDSFLESASSLVKIRLHGDFGRTTVHLTHLDLGEADHCWYGTLWESSLRKLACLF